MIFKERVVVTTIEIQTQKQTRITKNIYKMSQSIPNAFFKVKLEKEVTDV